MYIPPANRVEDRGKINAFIQAYGFATIVTDHEGRGVRNVNGLGGRMTNAAGANTAETDMTADAFKSAVRQKLQAAQ